MVQILKRLLILLLPCTLWAQTKVDLTTQVKSSVMTTNTVPKWTGSTGLANGCVLDDGTHAVRCDKGYDVNSLGAFVYWVLNNTVTGTTVNKMVCDDGTGKGIICPFATSTTNDPLGVAIAANGATPGTSGSTGICNIGFCTVVMDNSATTNHYAQQSTSVDGDLSDIGASPPTNGQPYWHIFAGNSGAGTTAIFRNMDSSELNATSGGNGKSTTVQVNGTSTKNVANLVNGTGITFGVSNSGNTTTIIPTVTVSGGITSINTSATGPAVTIQGVGATGVSTSGNTISISGGAAGNIAGTWVNQGGNYTVLDSDNTSRLRFTTGAAAITLPQPGTITSSPVVGLKFNQSLTGGTTTFTSGSYTQTFGNQMYVVFIAGENNPLTLLSDSRSDVFTLVSSSNGSGERVEVYYCANLLSSGSTTMTINLTSAVTQASGLFTVELTGTTHDNTLSTSVNGGAVLTLTNPIHFQNVIAMSGGRTSTVVPSPPFIEIDTISNGNVGTLSDRLLSNQNSTSVQMTGSNPVLFQSILSISNHPAFVAGWLVTMENVSTSIQTVTSTSSTINGQTTKVLAPNEICTFMSNAVNWDAVCGFAPNVQTNGVQGGEIEVAGVNTSAAGADQGTTTLITTGAVDAFYEVKGSIACHGVTSTGTSTLTITYTDTSNTVQTLLSGAAACTTLGAASVSQVNPIFRAKASTNIQYGFAHTGTQPTVDVSVAVYQLSTK